MASKPEVDLKTSFCGLQFRNPIVVAAGVHGRDGQTMAEVARSGVAAVCTKTIVSRPAPDVLPCFVQAGPGMLNAVFGSDRSAEYWFGEGIKRAKEGEARVIANLAGFSPRRPPSWPSEGRGGGGGHDRDAHPLPAHGRDPQRPVPRAELPGAEADRRGADAAPPCA